MNKFTQITLLFTLIASGTIIPSLQARNVRPRVYKSIDVSDDPKVNAAEKRYKDARDALRDAESKGDKAAIESARKSLDEARKDLSEIRNRAFSDAKKKQGRR